MRRANEPPPPPHHHSPIHLSIYPSRPPLASVNKPRRHRRHRHTHLNFFLNNHGVEVTPEEPVGPLLLTMEPRQSKEGKGPRFYTTSEMPLVEETTKEYGRIWTGSL
jgi:hypothetical protein